ncbi:MAG: hypothetical protein ACR2LK_08955 [Solirubrobacteraceae bacterium]
MGRPPSAVHLVVVADSAGACVLSSDVGYLAPLASALTSAVWILSA